MIVIHTKPGTHPGQFMRVKSLRRAPRVGEKFFAKRSNHLGQLQVPGERWSQWRVTEIKHNRFNDDLFMLEAW